MAERSHIDAVGSGVPYVVTHINGKLPTTLEQFDGKVEMVLSSEDQQVKVNGEAVIKTNVAVIHEKDAAGKDVRVWEITRDQGFYTAVEQSTY
jgi:hypothetical protein